MTQSFEEYLEEKARGTVKCPECKNFICYGEVCDESVVICSSCMKKEYEKNKKL